MRIAFLTSADARQPLAWSGTPYFMARALSKVGDVSYVGPVFSPVEFSGRVRSRLSRLLGGRGYTHDHSLALARDYASLFRGKIPRDADIVVVPAGSTQSAYLDTNVPVYYTSDATFALMHDYYPVYSRLSERYVREAHEIERRALERASVVLYPSEWAARSARDDYGVPGEKIHVVPYGANLSEVPARGTVLAAKAGVELQILFLGVDWERKGGPIAFETASLLRREGLPARLTVCGCVPPERYRAEWLEVIPRLDKRRPDDAGRLSRLLLEAAFLLVPSRFECYGIVYCEASAHGTPSVATDTGGVAGAVRDGENGFLIPAGAGPEAYARAIGDAFSSRERYLRLAASSRGAYEERLNWDAWARAVEDLAAATRPT